MKDAAEPKEATKEEEELPKEAEDETKEPSTTTDDLPPSTTEPPPLNTELPQGISFEGSELQQSPDHPEDDYFNYSNFITDVTLRRWSGQPIIATADLQEPATVGATTNPIQEERVTTEAKLTNAEPTMTVEAPTQEKKEEVPQQEPPHIGEPEAQAVHAGPEVNMEEATNQSTAEARDRKSVV